MREAVSLFGVIMAVFVRLTQTGTQPVRTTARAIRPAHRRDVIE